MEIAIIASDSKKELMTEFCIAYQGILCKHNLYATDATGKYISDATGLDIECVMSGTQGGVEQLSSRILSASISKYASACVANSDTARICSAARLFIFSVTQGRSSFRILFRV